MVDNMNEQQSEGIQAEESEQVPPTEETPEGDKGAAETPPSGIQPKSPQPKPVSEVQKRINFLTAKANKTEAENARLKRENDALKRKSEAGARPQPPDINQFMDDDTGNIDSKKYSAAQATYEDKLFEWQGAQNIPETPAASEEPQGESGDVDPNLNSAFNSFDQRAAAMREQHPDFDEVIDRPYFNVDNPDFYLAIFESEAGPEIAYYLGSNEAEARRIGTLSPVEVGKEIAKLEARFSNPERRVVSETPEPINPLDGNASVEKDPEKMSTDEWMKWDQQNTLKKRGLVKTPGG